MPSKLNQIQIETIKQILTLRYSINIETSERNGSVIGSFPVEDSDDVMLVTNAGRIIRSPVNDIRIASRNTQGVTLFSIEKGETVVSVTAISTNEDNQDNIESENIDSKNVESENIDSESVELKNNNEEGEG